MNLLHMKYAVEIADTKSINKASEKLYVGASSLSRAIKELEESLSITIFDRSAKGMEVTPEGEVFLRYARAILQQVDDVERLFQQGETGKRQFSVSVPRASYISEAFVRFSNEIRKEEKAEIFYKETNSYRAIRNILKHDYRLGIVRYEKSYEHYYQTLFSEKGLCSEQITEFSYVCVMSVNSPLAGQKFVTFQNLKNQILIAHADSYVPSLPLNEVQKEELQENSTYRIFIFERGSQFELLSENPDTYMWVSPIPEPLLKRYGLIQKQCPENKHIYRDVLIYRKDTALTELDQKFISQLMMIKKQIHFTINESET